MNSSSKRILLLIVSMMLASGSWYFVDHLLVAFQIRDAASNSRPRGNLSDLYPRWLGARELLLRGRDPYSTAITREIQQGYYGRVLDPSRPNDPKDQEAFTYPAYVVFLLSPTIGFSFERVRQIFIVASWLITIGSVFLWMRMLNWRPHPIACLSIVTLTIGSMSFIQGVKLQQLTLVVAALLAGSFAAALSGFLLSAGVLLAFATIKPQLALLPAMLLLAWSLIRWRERWRLTAGFLSTLMTLILAAEFILPGWVGRFVTAMRNYRVYTHNSSLLITFLTPTVARAVEALLFLSCVALCALLLRSERGDRKFVTSACLILSLVVVLVPSTALYNQILLLPALLLLAQRGAAIWKRSKTERLFLVLSAFTFLWPFVTCSALAVVSLYFSAEAAQARWQYPFYAAFVLPLVVFATIAVHLAFNVKYGSSEY
jgi:hypothetical protein